MKYVFKLSIPAERAKEILLENTYSNLSVFALQFGSLYRIGVKNYGVYSACDDKKFWLYLKSRENSFWNTSPEPMFYGVITDEGEGAVIEGRFHFFPVIVYIALSAVISILWCIVTGFEIWKFGFIPLYTIYGGACSLLSRLYYRKLAKELIQEIQKMFREYIVE